MFSIDLEVFKYRVIRRSRGFLSFFNLSYSVFFLLNPLYPYHSTRVVEILSLCINIKFAL